MENDFNIRMMLLNRFMSRMTNEGMGLNDPRLNRILIFNRDMQSINERERDREGEGLSSIDILRLKSE